MLVMPVILKDMYALKKYGANNTTESVTSHSVSTRFKNPCDQCLISLISISIKKKFSLISMFT